ACKKQVVEPINTPFKESEAHRKETFQNGDIIFQTSTSAQSKAIQLATHSKYSHMGMILEKDGSWYVLEAVQPVKYTPIEEWVDRGEKDAYVVKRLQNSQELLDSIAIEGLKKEGAKYLGKDYDLQFAWSDEKIYCSELVWKMYKAVLGVELGALEELQDFDLSHPMVQRLQAQTIQFTDSSFKSFLLNVQAADSLAYNAAGMPTAIDLNAN
ncbi:unnamed protein product, partial [Cyprideis torosa]